MVKDFVLVWRSDVTPGSIKLVGPFDTEPQAATWGRIWQASHQGNPCWNTIQLDDAAFTRAHIAPSLGQFLVLPILTPGTPEANS